jgi:hypothetical protein
MEHVGVPVDADYLLGEVAPHWPMVRMHFIQRDDRLGLHDEDGHFNEKRLYALNQYYGWGWARTPSGRLEVGRGAFSRMADRLGEGPNGPLRTFQHLHDRIAELRLNKLVETIGADGYARVSTMPFWTRTGETSRKAAIAHPSSSRCRRGPTVSSNRLRGTRFAASTMRRRKSDSAGASPAISG